MSIASIAKRAGKVTADNAPAILTAIGVTGAITTAVLAGKASFKAAEVIAREQARHDLEEQSHPFDFKEKAELTWKLFVPAVGTAALTVTAIVMSNRISTRRAAALASAYTVSQEFFKEYKKSVVDHIGKDKEKKVREVAMKEMAVKNPPPLTMVVSGTDCMVHELYTGTWFTSSYLALQQAEIEINFQIMHNGYASVSDFLRLVGATHSRVAEEIGWNTDRKLELDIGSDIEDGKPILTLDFRTVPVREYGSSY